MIKYFDENELLAVKKQYKNTIITIVLMCVAFLAVALLLVLTYAGLPYQDERGTMMQVLTMVASAIYIFFIYITIGIKLKRVKKYLVMLNDLNTITPAETVGIVKAFNEALDTKDGVDTKCIIISVYVERRQDWFDRYVFVPYERELPPLKIDSKVKFYTVNNNLYGYEELDGENAVIEG